MHRDAWHFVSFLAWWGVHRQRALTLDTMEEAEEGAVGRHIFVGKACLGP